MAKSWLAVALAAAAILGTACSSTPLAPHPGAATGIGAEPGTSPGYQAIDLGTLGGGRTFPSAINDMGSITGISETADGRQVGFVYTQGAMHALRPSQDVFNESADAINSIGQIGGVVRDGRTLVRWNYGINGAPELETRATPAAPVPPPDRVVAINDGGDMLVSLDDYVASARGIVLHAGVLDDLGGLDARVWTYPVAWNAHGLVVGSSHVRHVAPTYEIFHPFVWDAGVMKDLGVLGPLTCGDAHEDCAGGDAIDINAQGSVVGTVTGAAGLERAFLWQDGVMRDLGVFEGHSTRAIAINDRGQILLAVDSPDLGIFVWENGGVQRVGPVGVNIWARALGANGEVVGELHASDGSVHAFVWSAGSLTDLGPGSARAINARGDIIGTDGLRGMLWRKTGSTG